MGMGYHYRAKGEFICFLEKGHRQLSSRSIPDNLDPADLDALIKQKKIYRGFPTEKPPEISAVLIEQSTEPGDRVIDPFCGSGSVGVAARRLGRRFAGSDICAEAVVIASARVKEAVDSDSKFDSVAAGGG
jgi:site-specific DNA-methyltransferase (adenine-specific)